MNRPRYHILLIFIVGLLAYSNTFNAPFHFDDTQNIVENPLIKNWQYFREPSSARQFEIGNLFYSRYIGYLTFALNYHIHGLDVAGYHIVNLAVHIINAVLVYVLVILTFRTPYFRTPLEAPLSNGVNSAHNIHGIALFSALLFVSHPIQTQAVTYIVQRFASLATMFYLLSLVAYIQWRLITQNTENRRQKTDKRQMSVRLTSVFWYLSSVFSAILAMKTKEIAFTLPVIIALYEFMFFEGKARKRILYLVPLLLTMLIIPLTLIRTGAPTGEIMGEMSEATRLQTTMSRLDYLFTQFRVIVTYIRLLLLPINQNLDYDYPVYHSFFDSDVLLSLLFLLTIFGMGIYLLYRSRRSILAPDLESSTLLTFHASLASRLAAFGIFWFFITLSVESSIIPIIDVIFEHRLYLPSVGAFISITTFALVFFEMAFVHSAWRKKAAVPLLVVMILSLTGATYARNNVWKDDAGLWEDVVSKSPMKARGRNNLGNAYLSQNSTNKAIEQFKAALTLKPDFAEAYNNLGSAYHKKGLTDKAIECYETSLKFKADYPSAHNNLGIAYRKKGITDKAIEHYRMAIRANPEFAGAHFNLGLVFLSEGKIDDARKEFEIALQINPDHYNARRFLNYLSTREN